MRAPLSDTRNPRPLTAEILSKFQPNPFKSVRVSYEVFNSDCNQIHGPHTQIGIPALLKLTTAVNLLFSTKKLYFFETIE